MLILANAKKMELSFDELNLFRLRDFIEFTEIYFENPEKEESGVREATQADIDKMLR